ncbi:MAG TPA: ATP-binding cassette domain-containing protein [Anaerolineales bacterium]|nr:ATP-binding cassette domain-containing protein [Anaerolineales bacterium]
MKNILVARDLRKTYGENEAVKGVSFEIKAGEIFSLLGPNGAGKTTTISMLSGLIAPTAGDADIAGHSIVRDSLRVRERIGVVPQEIALYDDLTARENLTFWGQMYGLSGGRLKTRIAAVLEQIGLSDRANERIKTYSGGMKRRVNIGVGLLHEPQLLFMDEPTVGIDPQSRRAILDTVKALNTQGMAVLYTTHYMEEAAELSDRVGIIDHGKMIALGTQRELAQQIGGRETLSLHIGDDQNSQALAEVVRGLPGVDQASAMDHTVSVIVASAAEALAPVVGAASANGFRIRGVEVTEPDLESVFLHLTGRALRD